MNANEMILIKLLFPVPRLNTISDYLVVYDHGTAGFRVKWIKGVK